MFDQAPNCACPIAIVNGMHCHGMYLLGLLSPQLGFSAASVCPGEDSVPRLVCTSGQGVNIVEVGTAVLLREL